MSQAICAIPPDTVQQIRKFRLTPIKQGAQTIPAQSYKINAESTTLVVDETLTLDSLEDLVEELPDNSPRFLLLNYGYTKADGRFVNPLVGVYWRPVTTKGDLKMLYAGSVENFKSMCNCNVWLECQDEEDVEELKELIEG